MAGRAKRVALGVLKVAALVFVGLMVLAQLPELAYDLGTKTPLAIEGPGDLEGPALKHPTFVAVSGRGDFSKAFLYETHAVPATYFLVEPYGARLVARTYEPIEDEEAWGRIRRFMGRLKPFDAMAFDGRVRGIYRERFEVQVPQDAFFLALDDVPRLSGWNVAAVVFASCLWLALFYLFFVRRWEKPAAAAPERPAPEGPAS